MTAAFTETGGDTDLTNDASTGNYLTGSYPLDEVDTSTVTSSEQGSNSTAPYNDSDYKERMGFDSRQIDCEKRRIDDN